MDPFNQSIPMDQLRQRIDRQVGGMGREVKNDLAFQPPSNPLHDAKGRTGLIYRDIPIVTIQNNWTVPQVRGALASHTIGVFEESGQLVDSLIADPRVMATLNTRLAGVFGREQRFFPANSSSAAKEVMIAYEKAFPEISAGGALKALSAYTNLAGEWPAQLIWNTTGNIEVPHIVPWHLRYTWYDWSTRTLVAITQDGSRPIFAGDGKWLLHAPRGEYRGWMWGTLRAVAQPWLLRNFAQRDMARRSEVYGQPIRKAYTPASADPVERDRFQHSLSNLGSETTILLGRGVDANDGYDLELLEAASSSAEVFSALISQCDMDIILAIMSQNLTTEVTSGSFAATKVHDDILQVGIESDNTAIRTTLHDQVARAFAYVNFGDADLAPWTDWDCAAKSDYQINAANFYSFGQAIQILRQGGVAFPDASDLADFARKTFGIQLPNTTEITEPDAGAGAADAAAVSSKSKK